jgi:hypothetical protein
MILQQDSVINSDTILKKSVSTKTDSAAVNTTLKHEHITGSSITLSSQQIQQVTQDTIAIRDTITECRRNGIADVTFYDSTNFIINIGSGIYEKFPFQFLERGRKINDAERVSLMKSLKPGLSVPVNFMHDDWIILVVILAVSLYSVIWTSYKKNINLITRFLFFRGISEPSAHESGGFFYWQSTLSNLNTFLIIGLFIYSSGLFFGFVPHSNNKIIYWLIAVAVIIVVVTLRHFICVIVGRISGENEAFRDYLVSIYTSYRLSAMILLFAVILALYTEILSTGVIFISGVVAFGLMYLIRIIHLSIIFINRNISIFYLILYLCALEFLPVVISIKYFTGLA